MRSLVEGFLEGFVPKDALALNCELLSAKRKKSFTGSPTPKEIPAGIAKPFLPSLTLLFC